MFFWFVAGATSLNTTQNATPTPTATTAQPLQSPCFSQCSLIYQNINICGMNSNNISCFCPAYVEQGEQCYSCWETAVGSVGASEISEASTNCQSLGYTASNVKTTTTTTSRAGSVTFDSVPTTGIVASTATATSGAGLGVGQSWAGLYIKLVSMFVVGVGLFAAFI